MEHYTDNGALSLKTKSIIHIFQNKQITKILIFKNLELFLLLTEMYRKFSHKLNHVVIFNVIKYTLFFKHHINLFPLEQLLGKINNLILSKPLHF